ncbi:hypothetical protein P3T76_010252 [Phytophthora citrophthora]|uniref:Uncharacterized protein n=1 Tax=Phytophthora citrophthora TaxID=4793 RepID=A0AAD9LH91_9STRA|nr:hypothetical protein P3T76_010252 [Phytophthora citrophthora]
MASSVVKIPALSLSIRNATGRGSSIAAWIGFAADDTSDDTECQLQQLAVRLEAADARTLFFSSLFSC